MVSKTRCLQWLITARVVITFWFFLLLCSVVRSYFVCLQSEPVDLKPLIEKECHKPCQSHWVEYEKCKERIKTKGEGSCEPWSFDYWKCVDKCVSMMFNYHRLYSVAVINRSFNAGCCEGICCS